MSRRLLILNLREVTTPPAARGQRFPPLPAPGGDFSRRERCRGRANPRISPPTELDPVFGVQGLNAGRPSRPRVPWRPRLQLRTGERLRSLTPGRGLLHARETVVLPAPREGRAVQRGARPPRGARLRRRLPRGLPDRRGPRRAPLPELRAAAGPSSGAASRGGATCCRSGECRRSVCSR